MSQKYSPHKAKVTQRLVVLLVVLVVVGIGTYLLTGSHAATPYVSATADSGTLANGATKQTCSGATDGSCIIFNSTTTGSGGGGTTTTCQSVVIPAYFDPGDSGNPWATATAAGLRSGSIMIANPDSGPGSSLNSSYPAVIANARAAGIRVFGYVDTADDKDSIASVEANVNTWKSLYNVTDIFLDDVSGTAADEAYYQTLSTYVHQQTSGSLTILNPGDVPDQSYMNAGDVISTFEDSYAAWQKATFPAWIKSYAPNRFLNIVINVPDQATMTQILGQMEQDGVGYVYVTNDNLPNPYDTVPPYLSAEGSQAAANCSL